MKKIKFFLLLSVCCISCKCYAQYNVSNSLAEISQGSIKNKLSQTDSLNLPSIAIKKHIINTDTTSGNLNKKINQSVNSANRKAAQGDTLIQTLQSVPKKYLEKVDDKIDKYNSRVNKKTEKTLERLSHWELKIKPVLQEANPQAAQRLFGNNQMTFTTLLQKYKDGEAIQTQYHTQYNAYNDKITNQVKYLNQQKGKLDSTLIKPVSTANMKVDELNQTDETNEAVQQFIQQRRKQLIDGSLQYIGNNPYLKQINQESFYYIATVKNYKEILSDPQKTEKTATDIINKIPAYQKFTAQNSQLASMFGLNTTASSVSDSSDNDTSKVAGLQTRSAVQQLLSQKVSGTNASSLQQSITQNIQQAPMQLSQLKAMAGSSSGNSITTGASNFKPNMQKTKTFLQRLQYSTNIQFVKSNTFIPATASLAFTTGYKLNDLSLIGIGINYNIGLGTLQAISITQQGLGLRSFIDWKIKKQWYATGGYEMNYNTQFASVYQLKNNVNAWQKSALIGLTRKINIKSKLFKTTDVQLLYDMLASKNIPKTQPLLFRVGYSF